MMLSLVASWMLLLAAAPCVVAANFFGDLKGAKLQLLKGGALAGTPPLSFDKLLGGTPAVVFAVRRPG